MFCNQLLRHCFDTVRICDVEFDGLDTRIGLHDGVQMALTSARNDHFVPTVVQLLGQTASNTRSTVGNEDRISSEIHDFSNLLGIDGCVKAEDLRRKALAPGLVSR